MGCASCFSLLSKSLHILPMEWNNRPKGSWKQITASDGGRIKTISQYWNAKEVFHTGKQFIQSCSWNWKCTYI